jgi:hypothetical protein
MAKLEFREPTGEDAAGFRTYTPSKSAYEGFMEEEGIPIFRGIGVHDTRELELGDWKRRGGKGMFLALSGLEGLKGMFVIEVPPRGALNPEKHMYDEFYLVVEGRGTTEVWTDRHPKPQVFEWGPGTLFMAPLNAYVRMVNAGSGRALMIASNNAPPVMNIYQSRRFVFDNPYEFTERFDGSPDFFKPKSDLEMEPVRGRAAVRSNVFPDVTTCELPLDNQRAPGYRRIQPYFHGFMADATTGGFISQYPSGRYSKAHYHLSGAVLVCLRGKGYTYNWPVDLGPHPWETGHADQVDICEYVAGGLVAAAPGGGNWFHQHFSASKDPMRVINYWGGPTGRWGLFDEVEEAGDGKVKAGNLFGIHEGGRTILYHEEDPHIRNYYAQRLRDEGVEIQMAESLYQQPA